MLLSSNILLIIINAVTFRRESLFSFSRVTIMIFLTGSLAICIGSGLEIYGGLFHSTVTTQRTDLFIYIIGAMILLLTGFSPRSLIKSLMAQVLDPRGSRRKTIEYLLIILFTIGGSIALMSSSDYLTVSAQSLDLNLQGIGVMASLHPGQKGFGSLGKRFIRTSAKAHLTLSPELKEVIVGSMLGDLSSERPNSKCNTRMQFKQSMINREYLLHLYSLFSDYCGSSPLSMSKFDSRPNKMKEYHAIKFQTLSLPCFNVYRDMFYLVKPGVLTAVKIIPKDLGELLTLFKKKKQKQSF